MERGTALVSTDVILANCQNNGVVITPAPNTDLLCSSCLNDLHTLEPLTWMKGEYHISTLVVYREISTKNVTVMVFVLPVYCILSSHIFLPFIQPFGMVSRLLCFLPVCLHPSTESFHVSLVVEEFHLCEYS